MRITNLDDPNLPFALEELPLIIDNILKDVDDSQLGLDDTFETTILYNRDKMPNLKSSFQVDVKVQKDEKNNKNVYFDKITIFESDDEFLDAFLEIKKRNN